MATTSRLLTLLSLLQARRDWPGAVLAERLGVSDRTVRRDVERLREMGYRIDATMGPDGGYRLDAGNELPPLLFDDEQVIALAVGLQAAVGVGAGVAEAAVRALTTVRQVMPARVRDRLDAVGFDTIATSIVPVDTEVLVALSRAVRAREVLRFDYVPLGSDEPAPERPPRRVEPHHLVTAQGRWYLVAWDLERDDWRIFRADRIRPRLPTALRFARRSLPGGDVTAFVSARFAGSDAGDRWPCVGTVILHAPARTVLPFAGDGIVEDLGTDRCRLTSGSWSWVALAASLGRFDVDVKVEEPPELAAAFGRLARRYDRAGA